MTKVSVVIPVFNQSQLTQRCLLSLLSHSHSLSRVWVIDNASRDDTAAVLNRFHESFQQAGISFEVITNPENVGFGRACNQGVREFLKTDASHLVILNNDTWLMPNWDTALIEAMKKRRLDAVGPYFHEKPFHDRMEQTAQDFILRNGKGFRHHFVAILMFFSREAIIRLSQDCEGTHGGIFDERFFVTYEDADLLYRMRGLNMQYGQTGSCFIWHHSKATRESGSLPSNYEREGLRLFIEKWGFDPIPADHTWKARLRRRYWRIREKLGKF